MTLVARFASRVTSLGRTLTVRNWLRVCACVVVAPTAILAGLYWQRSEKDIDFAARERLGVVYLRALAPAWTALEAEGASPARHAAALAELRRVRSALDGPLDTSAHADRAERALQIALSAPDPARADAARARLAELVARVAGTSNLVLDPDLDSYHLMDLASSRLPALAVAAHRARVAARDASEAGRVEGLRKLGRLDAAWDDAAGSLAAARAAALRPAPALAAPAAALERGVAVLRRQGEAASAVADIAPLKLAALEELDGLLAARIAGFQWQRARDLSVAALALLGAHLLVYGVLRLVLHRLWRLRASLEELRQRDIHAPVPLVHLADETGAIARAVQRLRDHVVGTLLSQSAEEAKALLRNEQRDASDRAGRRIEEAVGDAAARMGGLAGEVATATTALSVSAAEARRTLEGASERLHAGQREMADAAANVSAIVAAIDEIARSSSLAIDVVEKVSRGSDHAVERARALAADVGAIDRILDLVTAVAAQTNLLALNATIEAARAGEAGRGFAVVANEVKHLAGESAAAASEISRRIQAIREATGSVVDLIGDVAGSLGEVQGVASSIAAATSEQGVAANAIDAQLRRVADDYAALVAEISAASDTSRATDAASASIASLAETVAEGATELRGRVAAVVTSLAA